ncbi:energy transducer TonB [Acinetobacter sichuanensis]|uniref:Energy transducer TonB n=1 Tax=Acinetobacter sichuanensis TaxID=2136183 RepID=A0A371YUN6_9GAMM|nr:energy transducer TonB [Acinetobacter sichuanensis]RFC85185.1 energy transducer TonB [Acinetobacter sichuanensis]
MSQSSTSNMQAPNPMKKKVITAVIAVLVGHLGALWALSHLKTPELQPIEKKPIQVKFVQIKEDVPPPPPPPPPPPVKPKVEPKPVVEKKVTPPPPPIEKPKLITQKQPVVEKKAIQQPEEKIDHEKIKREQEQQRQQQEQQRQEQLRQQQEQQRQEQQRLEQQRQEQLRQQQEQQRQEQQRLEQQRRQQEEANQPRKLTAGEISWKNRPSFEFDDDLLRNQARSLVVRIQINPAGKITDVTVIKSSGLPNLDREVRSAVRSARMNPSNDGRAMVADLPVNLQTSGQ